MRNVMKYFEKVDKHPENRYKDLRGWDAVVYWYLTLPYGMDLYFWKDGQVTVYQYNTHPSSMEDVVAVVPVPGPSNIDTSGYEDGLEWDDKRKVYVDPFNNKVVGRYWQDIVYYLIKEFGLDDDIEFIQSEVKESLLDE